MGLRLTPKAGEELENLLGKFEKMLISVAEARAKVEGSPEIAVSHLRTAFRFFVVRESPRRRIIKELAGKFGCGIVGSGLTMYVTSGGQLAGASIVFIVIGFLMIIGWLLYELRYLF